MLEGKLVNLRISEKEDIPLLMQWFNDVSFAGDYQHYPDQISYAEIESQIVERKNTRMNGSTLS